MFSLEVPKIRQRDNFDCGAASLRIMFEYAGKPLPQLYYNLSSAYRGMEPQTAEAVLLASFPSIAFGLGWDIADLEHQLASNRPVMALVSIDAPSDHWVVVRGVKGGSVLFQDPARGRRSKSIKNWLELWTGPETNPYPRYAVTAWGGS